jgi:hypothetical protein
VFLCAKDSKETSFGRRHHDFIIPVTSDPYQATRFATILLYLNDEGLKGGETSFPRWLNGATREILQVKPKVGKAVLFYNQLPDGNYDERSQHAAQPVIEGEKWLVRKTVMNCFCSLSPKNIHPMDVCPVTYSAHDSLSISFIFNAYTL